jgi:hypothetical protein
MKSSFVYCTMLGKKTKKNKKKKKPNTNMCAFSRTSFQFPHNPPSSIPYPFFFPNEFKTHDINTIANPPPHSHSSLSANWDCRALSCFFFFFFFFFCCCCCCCSFVSKLPLLPCPPAVRVTLVSLTPVLRAVAHVPPAGRSKLAEEVRVTGAGAAEVERKLGGAVSVRLAGATAIR